MLNFKFLKRASVFFVLTFFMAGYSAASAGFITIYPDDKDSGLGNGMTAAVVDAIPAKTDGEIIDCFDYYRFPSIQASFEPVNEFYEPGQTVYFKGELINKNNYPIADGYLFVRIARFNENYIQEGHDIVDEFFAKSGPQGREKFYLEGNEKKGTVFSWKAPENLPTGVYRVTFFFIVGKKMNLAGLSFTNEVVAGLTEFEVRKSVIGAKRVFLEKSSFAVNGNKYDHIGLWPQIGKGAKAEATGKLKNETPKKENVQLVYDLYYWDGLDAQNKISSRSEDITVAPNSSYSFKYIIPKMDETVYFLRITSIAGNNQKSVVNLRVVSEEERPRINFFSPLKFPVLKGETMTNFACFHNTADKDTKGKVMMNVFDESGDKVQTLGYEGKITGNIMAVKKDTVASSNYDYLRMAASVIGADGRETDSYEMIYDCKNMNPENQECARIQEEKAKAAADASNKSLGKKGLAFGIAALMAILAIAALSRKFLLNKTKPPLMFLLFAFIVGSALFLAGGTNNQALAKNITESKDYRFPKDGIMRLGGAGKFYIGGYVNIVHRVKRGNTNDTLKFGDKVTFTYEPDDPFWGATGASWDSPYGIWCAKGRLEKESCLEKKDKSYELLENSGQNDEVKFTQSDDNRNYYMTFAAEKPEVYLKSSDESIISCDGMVCAAKNKKGAVTVTAHIDSFIARPFFKTFANNGTPTGDWGVKNTDGGFYDLNFDGSALKWDFTVDPPPVECNASFSPAAITAGGSTAFSWETKYDEDGIIPILCDGDISDINDSGDSGGASGSWTNLKPTKTQTCTATAMNSNGAKSCSAKVTVSSAFPLTINKIGAGKGEVDLKASNSVVTFIFNDSYGSVITDAYESGTNVALTANTSVTSTFGGWTGCSTTSGSGNNVCNVVISNKQSITVKFDTTPSSSSSSSVAPPSKTPDELNNFTASAACRKVNLEWSKDSNGQYNTSTNNGDTVVEYYVIKRDGSVIESNLNSNINRSSWTNNSYTDNSATDTGKEYSYTIKACNDQDKCSAEAGPAKATPNAGPCIVNPTSSTPTSSTPTSSSSSSDPDWYNLTFKTSGSGSGNATRYTYRHIYDDTWGWTGSKTMTMNNGDTAGIGRDYKFKLVPNPSSGSYFSSWSDRCDSVNSDNECLLEKNPYPGADKTVTATFNDSTSGCVGCGGSVKAYISARDTVVTDGNSTVVTWTSDNADSCAQIDSGLGSGGYKDSGWLTAGNTTSGSYTTANFTTSDSDGFRTYTIKCAKGSQSADAEVTVRVGDYKDSPSVSIWADPQSIGYKKTSLIKWLSSNVLPDCAVYSGASYFGGGNNNLTGQTTGKLTSNTTYEIRCIGYGPTFSRIKKPTTVTVAAPVSNFTLTNSSGKSLVANIVEGLSANSNSIALSLSGEAIGNVSLSASIPAISGAKAQFATSADNGNTWSGWSDAPLNNIDISVTSQIKLKVINIPGATAIGTYNVAITATDTGTGGITRKPNVNLQVNRVSSEWEEF